MIEEKEYLKKVINEIELQTKDINKELIRKSEENKEFKKYIWESKLDEQEIALLRLDSDLDVRLMGLQNEYIKKLVRAENSPYFGRIDFNNERIYIGITYLEKDEKHLVYDWRAPISNMFYDFGVGDAFYNTPSGIIKGVISKRRQFKIENKQLIRMFDSDINVVDEILQDVLSDSSKEKMKNIVNTIQMEQNKVIRNTEDRNLIVQGIAGSGKTSVALHRIAYLLYKIKYLNSNNVLIFSPNNIFSEYISNVLPELGEQNTIMTTFSDISLGFVKYYEKIESFNSFVERYYTNIENNRDLVKLKLSDDFKTIIDKYVLSIEKNLKFISDIETDKKVFTKEELNEMLKDRYSSLPIIERLNKIAENIANFNKNRKVNIYFSYIKKSINYDINYKNLYFNLFKSNLLNIVLSEKDIRSFVNRKVLNYEDSILFIYLICLLEGFMYNPYIKQIVIDEAQDYTYLQYLIIRTIFKKADFTILGDVNQTINPYYKYESLERIKSIFKDSSYIELTKTYRSSQEIIDYTNKILNLKYVSAIRNKNNIEVVEKKEVDLKSQLNDDIASLIKKYKSVAIITKTDEEAEYVFNLMKSDFKNLSLLKSNSEKFNRNLIVISSYLSKGLEFDAVISYNFKNNKYIEKNLFYVVCTRAQHELIIYNRT